MSNVLYDNNLFNAGVKTQYLNTLKNPGNVLRIFKAAAALEQFYNKDLHDFSRDELARLFFVLNPKNPGASYQNGRYVSAYLDWAMVNGYRIKINPLLSVDKQWYEQFVPNIKTLFTEDDLNKIIKRCKNAQDAVIIRLRMEGVGGNENSELVNLTINDIDQENRELHLVNHLGQKRLLTVSQECIDLCLEAYNQKTYLKKNGDFKKGTKSTMSNLIENEYILKTSLTKTKNYGAASTHLIHRRLDVLADFFGEPYLTAKNISYSGMLIMARDIYLEKGEISNADYNTILTRFGYDTENYESQYHRIRYEVLNEEKLKEIYNL